MKALILDKSYLQARARGDSSLCDLARRFRPVMLAELMNELFYDESDRQRGVRASFMRQLPAGEDPVALLDLVDLQKHEMQTRGPAHPVERFFQPSGLCFNPDTQELGFKLGAAQLDHIQRQRTERWGDFETRIDMMRQVVLFYPGLMSFKAGEPELLRRVTELKRSIAKDDDAVRAIWDRVRNGRHVAGHQIDRRWFIFRWVQVNVYYALDFVFRHGPSPGPNRPNTEDVTHDEIDSSYCIAGTLTGALATRETSMKDCFLALRPDGSLVSE